MKKFILYFILFFVVSFGFLNLRFVGAEFNFWLNQKQIQQNAVVEEKTIADKIYSAVKTATSPAPLPVNRDYSYSLEIPVLGVKAPIVMEPKTSESVILSDLVNGVVHYGTTPLPGESGASVILGHSSAYPWYKGKYGSVFALLGKLKTGDMIYIYKDGKPMAFKVSNSLIFIPLSNSKSISQFEKTDGSSIILLSCWPVGTNYKRIAIKADLVK